MNTTGVGIDKIADIRKILRDLLKVIKVVSLYPEDNPLPQSLKLSFAERLIDLINEHGELQIIVEKDQLLVQEEVVFQDQSKEDSLAKIFFDSGISQFTFLADITDEDIYLFLNAIKTYLNAPAEDRDLTVSLWESNQRAITFSTVEDIIMEEYDDSIKVQEFHSDEQAQSSRFQLFGTDDIKPYDSLFSNSSDDSGLISTSIADDETPTPEQQAALLFGVTEEQGEALHATEAARAMGYDDLPGVTNYPDASLIIQDEISLTEQEESIIQSLLRDDAEFDIYESTSEILKEMLLQEVEINGFYETVTICEKIVTELVHIGKLFESSSLLTFLRELKHRIELERPLWAERLKDALITAGSRERLKVLATALNENKNVGTDELSKYLNNFGPESLGGITELLGEFDFRHHREALCAYLTKAGTDSVQILSKGMYDKRWFVVRNTVMILARIGNKKSLSYLKEALRHPERRVRLELVNGIENNELPEALELLKQAVADDDSEIRQIAINAILSRRGIPAFEAITDIINDDIFLKLEQHHQQALLITFSRLGGDQAIGFLTELIQQRSLIPSHSVAFFRQAAFQALAHNRSEKAEKTLRKYSSTWRPELRRLATNALKQRARIMSGENV